MGIKLTKQDEQNIREIRERFPSILSVDVNRSRDGGFTAEVSTFSGCYTEAESFTGLVDMVNDAVKTYFEIPKKDYNKSLNDYDNSILYVDKQIGKIIDTVKNH